MPDPRPTTEPPTHPCRLAPLVREVGRYLGGPEASDTDRARAACTAFRNGKADFDAFAASARCGTDLVSVELAIRGGGRDLLSVYSHLPSPLTLLLVCGRNCEDGDTVGLRQRTAKCGTMLQEAKWPFGMAEAEMLTRPASTMFAELQQGEACQVRRFERTVRGIGRLATEREHAEQRRWFPRIRRWRDPERGLRGLSFRLGRVTRRVGRIRVAA
jgi:hypothetical protein